MEARFKCLEEHKGLKNTAVTDKSDLLSDNIGAVMFCMFADKATHCMADTVKNRKKYNDTWATNLRGSGTKGHIEATNIDEDEDTSAADIGAVLTSLAEMG